MTRFLLLLMALLCSYEVFSQQYTLADGEYMDTTGTVPPGCRDWNVFYYQVNGKYPESSFDILQRAHAFLAKAKTKYTATGYITFRYKIDCEGKLLHRVQVLQTDEKYRTTHFDKGLVNNLYAFLLTLDKWPIGLLHDKNPVAYRSFLSFKFKDGKIISIIP